MHPATFFVLRTPLLPFDTITSWGERLEAPAALDDSQRLTDALARDRARVREQIRALVSRPEIREALFIASPDLDAAIDGWLNEPDAPRFKSVERSLVRYVSRLSARATPFGLCAGTGVGRIAPTTQLCIPPFAAWRRHTRLDMDYLVLLAETLDRDPALAGTLRYRPNSSLHRSPDRWRYVETRLDGKSRSYHLVAVDDSVPLQQTIERAADGATRNELATPLVDDDVTSAEAAAFVADLIDSQILVSELAVPVTGAEPLAHLVSTLRARDGGRAVADTLATIGAELSAIDESRPGASPERYRHVARRLEALGASVDPARLFQVDLVRSLPAATLGDDVLRELARGIELLRRLAPSSGGDEIERFRAAFVERYEQREVPLLEALDEESGVGAAIAGGSGDASPLLRGLEFPPAASQSVAWGRRDAALLSRLGHALCAGSHEIALAATDIEELSDPEPMPLPAAYAVTATLVASGPAACSRGDFRVLLHNVTGPSGANLLGRFCHADAGLLSMVTRHLRDEAATDPEAIFAEIAHLPEGRTGNILLRPVLRDYEIPYLGASGAPPDRQIPATDLTLAVRKERLELRSRRLGRRVVPRLTTAHNFMRSPTALYRLLCLMQSEGHAAGYGWSWGVCTALPFLPRVTSGRLVLSRARWHVTAQEVRTLSAARGDERYVAVQAWRTARRLPRWVVVADWDNALPIDLDNVLMVESFVQLIREREGVELIELYPGPDDLCATSPDGVFVHELIVPFTAADAAQSRAPAVTVGSERVDAPPTKAARVVERTFAPGSTWVYAKLYCGVGTADRVLRDVVAPVSRSLMSSGRIARWFFIRYADPDPHLRWRLQVPAASGPSAVRRAVERAAAPLIADGRVRRLAFDTYEREVERYGGADAIEGSEEVFCADSDAVIGVLDVLASAGEAGADARWRVGVLGTDRLLSDFDLALDTRLRLMQRLRTAFGRECREDAGLRRQLAVKYRAVQSELAALLDESTEPGMTMGEARDAYRERSAQVTRLARRLRQHEADRRLTVSIEELASSHVHMHLNRLFRAGQRKQELVIYDLLARMYGQRLARAKAQ